MGRGFIMDLEKECAMIAKSLRNTRKMSEDCFHIDSEKASQFLKKKRENLQFEGTSPLLEDEFKKLSFVENKRPNKKKLYKIVQHAEDYDGPSIGPSVKDIARMEAYWNKKVVIPITDSDNYQQKLSTTGAMVKANKCWCHRNIKKKQCVKRELTMGSICSYIEVCHECGRVWSDVDDVSIPEYGVASNKMNHDGSMEVEDLVDINNAVGGLYISEN